MLPFHESYPQNAGRLQFAPPVPDWIEDVVLSADTMGRIAIPPGAAFAIFSFDGDVRFRLGTASTSFSLPTLTSTDGKGSELNPAARRLASMSGVPLSGATHLCLRAPAAANGSVSFYA